MITPPRLSATQLALARLVKPGDILTPTPEMIRFFSLTRESCGIVKVNLESHSQSGIAYAVQGLKHEFDASWFQFSTVPDPRFTDPSAKPQI